MPQEDLCPQRKIESGMEALGVEVPASLILFLVFLVALYKYLTSTWGTWSKQGISEVKPWLIVGSRPKLHKGKAIFGE